MTGNMSRKEFLTRLGFASLVVALNPTVLEGLTGSALQGSEKRIYPDSSPQPRSLYAPYWYVDESTESFVEIKNNLSSPLVITPLLNPSSGPPIRLDYV